jgi:hypothetical protein
VVFKDGGVSLLKLVEEELDVMAVRLLFCTVLSRSVSVPLVEVLDKGAMSLARSLPASHVASNRHGAERTFFGRTSRKVMLQGR